MQRGIESLFLICYPVFMSQTATIQDVLEAVNTFATHVDGRFAQIDKKFDHVDERFKELRRDIFEIKDNTSLMKQDITGLKINVSEIDTHLRSVEENMVTKDYLDRKLDGLCADLILMAQRANTKLSVLIEELVGQKVLTIEVARRILALEPFPQG